MVRLDVRRHFLTADMEKFHELWIMNEERCKEMAQKLLDADRIIVEQQLGLDWTPGDLTFMDNVGPIDTAARPKPSIDVVRELLTGPQDEGSQENLTPKPGQISNSAMRAIFDLLSDEGVRDRDDGEYR